MRRFVLLARRSWPPPPLAAAALPARAQVFPERPVRIVVPYAAGGATDVAARVLAEALAAALPQPVVVENRSGAAGMVRRGSGGARAADGHTLLLQQHQPRRAARGGAAEPRLRPAPRAPAGDGVLRDADGDAGRGTPCRRATGREIPRPGARPSPAAGDYGSTGGGGTLGMAALLLTTTAGLQDERDPVPRRRAGDAGRGRGPHRAGVRRRAHRPADGPRRAGARLRRHRAAAQPRGARGADLARDRRGRRDAGLAGALRARGHADAGARGAARRRGAGAGGPGAPPPLGGARRWTGPWRCRRPRAKSMWRPRVVRWERIMARPPPVDAGPSRRRAEPGAAPLNPRRAGCRASGPRPWSPPPAAGRWKRPASG